MRIPLDPPRERLRPGPAIWILGLMIVAGIFALAWKAHRDGYSVALVEDLLDQCRRERWEHRREISKACLRYDHQVLRLPVGAASPRTVQDSLWRLEDALAATRDSLTDERGRSVAAKLYFEHARHR